MSVKWYAFIRTMGGQCYCEEFDSKSELNQYLASIANEELAGVKIISGYTIEDRRID